MVLKKIVIKKLLIIYTNKNVQQCYFLLQIYILRIKSK